MRFGIVHRIMTNALAALGVLAVVTSAELGPWVNGIALVGLFLALLVPERWQQKPWLTHFATGGPLVLFFIEGGRLLSGQPAIDVAVEFAVLLQIVRLATRRGAAHDQQIILLSLLHFIVGTVLGGGLAFGLCFIGFLVFAPGALVLSHLRREVEGNYRQGARDRTGLPVDVPRILRSRRVIGKGFLASTGLLSVPIFLFTALLFLAFPRVGLSLLLINHGKSGRMVGFSDRVDLGDVGVLRSDPAIALRFEVPGLSETPPARLTLRLRGTAFDTYDGRAWGRSSSERKPEARYGDTFAVTRMPRPTDRVVTFDLESIDPPVIFFPTHATAFRLRSTTQGVLAEPPGIARGPEGEFRYIGVEGRGLRYEVFVGPEDEVAQQAPMSDADRRRYTSVPVLLPARVAQLAHRWTDSEPSERGKARIIEEHLKHEFTYDTNSPSGGTPQPVDHFLFESHRGHCEFFSTTMAMMLRAVNIPSRNVTGFVGGSYNRFGKYYAVREGDAHSWVEAYISEGPRSGWQTFDPTPTAGAQPLSANTGARVYVRDLIEAISQRWSRHVVGYDLRQQMHILDSVSARYRRARGATGLDSGIAGKISKRPVLTLFVLGVSAFIAKRAWERYKRRKPRTPKPRAQEKRIESATNLYRTLESAFGRIGLSRPAELPPLRFAEDLERKGHPLAKEIHSLTQVYLDVRFGGAELAPPQLRDFEGRVKALVQTT
jgi:protein-glutamine gamma-glutamyltransferase